MLIETDKIADTTWEKTKLSKHRNTILNISYYVIQLKWHILRYYIMFISHCLRFILKHLLLSKRVKLFPILVLNLETRFFQAATLFVPKTAANRSHLQVCMFGAPSLSRDSVAFLVLWKGLDRRQEPSIFTTEPVRLAPLLKCLNENVAFPAFQRQAHHTYILWIRFSRQQSKCTRFHTWRKLK